MNQDCANVIQTSWNTILTLVSYPKALVDCYFPKYSELGIIWLEKPKITKNSKFQVKH
jgi:hypothetical protein